MRILSLVTVAVIVVVCAAPQSRADRVDDVQAAREHYAKGKRLYDLGRFAEAAKEYEAAYEAKDDPALLFNLGQAHRLAGNYPQALLAYKAYVRNVPDAPNRREVEARITEMQAIVDEQQKSNQRPPQGTTEPKSLEAPATPTTTPPTTTGTEPASAAALTASAPPPKPTPIYKRWWLWTAVGVVAVGVGVGLGVGLGVKPKNPSPSLGGVTY